MKTVFLHIGKHKTGTSSFQRYMAKHYEFFGGRGLHVVREPSFRDMNEGDMVANLTQLANLVLRPELEFAPRFRKKIKTPTFEEQGQLCRAANTEFKKIPQDKLLVSSENFSFIRTQKEMRLLRLMFEGFEIRPIIVFRNKNDWMESWSTQMSRLGRKFPLLVEEHVGIFDFRPKSWMLQDKRIATLFGDNAAILQYEDLMERGHGTVPALLEVLGFEPQKCPDFESFWYNTAQDKSARNQKEIKQKDRTRRRINGPGPS